MQIMKVYAVFETAMFLGCNLSAIIDLLEKTSDVGKIEGRRRSHRV